MSRKRGQRRRVIDKDAQNRASLLEELRRRGSEDSKWLSSSNPIKRRIAALEVAWGPGIGNLAEDIVSVYRVIESLMSVGQQQEATILAMKSILIDKGIVSEEEFDERVLKARAYLAIVEERHVRDRDAEEHAALMEEELNEKLRQTLAEKAPDESAEEALRDVNPELLRMYRAATSQEESDVPEGAYFFKGSS